MIDPGIGSCCYAPTLSVAGWAKQLDCSKCAGGVTMWCHGRDLDDLWPGEGASVQRLKANTVQSGFTPIDVRNDGLLIEPGLPSIEGLQRFGICMV
jgi:hypothetical protein